MWRVWGGGKGSCYTPKNWHVLWRGFNIESQSSSNHWLSKAMIDRLLGTIIAPSQKHFWRWYFLFPKISQGEMLVWRIPSEPPKLNPCLPGRHSCPRVPFFGLTSRTTEPKVLLKNANGQATFLLRNHLVKIGKSNKNWDTTLEKYGKVNFEVKNQWTSWVLFTRMTYISLLGPALVIKFPTPNIIHQEFHANLHSRLLISSISRFSHSFSKYQGKEKVCKQFCWSLQIQPSCF